MRILFINPSTSRYTRSATVPLGLLSIASYLESKGHNVRIYDRTVDKTDLHKVIDTFMPQLTGISMLSYKSISDTLQLAEELKKRNIPVVIGGPLPSVLPEITLKNEFIDVVSVGEGEETWLELAEYYENGSRELQNIKGIAYRDSEGNVIRTEDRPFIDLAILPPINWRLVDVPRYFQSSYGCKKMLYLYAAKGCPHSCTFCYNKEFHRCTYRKRPLNILLDEIRLLVTEYGMDGVYFADEMWGKNKAEMREICESLKALKLDFVWGCQTRIGLFGDEDFSYMYECGCRWIFFGIESGSKAVLKKINKKIQHEKIAETFALCKKHNIVCIGAFIVGFPDETEENLKETVALIKALNTSMINVNYLVLIPGSDIYKDMIAAGRYKEIENLSDYRNKSPMENLEYNFSRIPDKDIKVVRAYYLWRSFWATDVPNTENFGFAKKVVADALKSVKTGEFISFTVAAFFAGIEFLKIAYYATFFNSIKKKYGIK